MVEFETEGFPDDLTFGPKNLTRVFQVKLKTGEVKYAFVESKSSRLRWVDVKTDLPFLKRDVVGWRNPDSVVVLVWWAPSNTMLMKRAQ